MISSTASSGRENDLVVAIASLFETIKCGVDTSAMDVLVRMDLTLTQLRVILVLLDSAEPRPIFEIADELHLSVATAGRAVEHLVKENLARRWEDPQDRRSKLVCLTEDGIGLTEIQRKAIMDQVRSFSSALPADVAEGLLVALRRALATVDHPEPHATATVTSTALDVSVSV